MALKLLRAAWFLSVLALLAGLLLAYAGWREDLVVALDEGVPTVVDREWLFYGLTLFIGLVNVLVYVISKFYRPHEQFRAWFHGLIMTINIFFIVAVNYIALYNSGEQYDFSRSHYFIYGCIGLVALWAVAWPLIVAYQKMFIKQSV